MPWVDFVKGVAIILVVMHHARDYALVLLPPDPSVVFRWSYIDPMLLYIRLPLFFAVSGLLASRRLAGDQLGRGVRKTGEALLVYLGWAMAMATVVPHWPTDGWNWGLDADTLLNSLLGESVLWYLWAIILAFAFCGATRSLSPGAACLLAVVIGILLERDIVQLSGSFDLFGRYLPFYCLGARYPELLVGMARPRSSVVVALLIFAYAMLLPVPEAGLVFDLMRSLIGVALALVGAGWAVAHLPRFAGAIGWLGRRTLPVYIFHFPIIASLGCEALRHGVTPSLHGMTMLLFLPLVTGLSILLSLGVWMLIDRLGLGWMLGEPRRAAEPPVERAPAAGHLARDIA